MRPLGSTAECPGGHLLARALGFTALMVMLAAVGGCAASPRPVANREPQLHQTDAACRGSSFDADEASSTCAVPAGTPRTPPREALSIRIAERPAVVRSGETAVFTLEIRNVTTAPLAFDLESSCLAWEAEASNATASTFESDCGGLCGREPTMLRFTLDPGGVVRKRVRLTATMRRVGGDECKEESLGPLPVGSYTMQVTLPWTDASPIPGNEQARASRTFEWPVVVVR